MAKPKKPRKPRKSKKIARDIAKIMAAVASPKELSTADLRRRSTSSTARQDKLDRDLPWRHSYANWCAHLGIASAKYNARIEYGSDTYEAWESGISPDAYARMHSRNLGI